jgi:hypothetical protein
MQGRREEAEVIVRFDQVDGLCHICVSSWPSMARKMARLYGQPLPKSGQRVHYWTVPLKAITFRHLSSIGKVGKRAGMPFPARKHREEWQFEKASAAASGSTA